MDFIQHFDFTVETIEKLSKLGVEYQPTLEATLQDWQKGCASDKKEEREKTVRSMLPEKKDIETLFPKHVEKLWPVVERKVRDALKHYDALAEELIANGEMRGCVTINVRKRYPMTFKHILDAVPKDALLFECLIDFDKGDVHRWLFVHVNGRWILDPRIGDPTARVIA